MQQLLCYSTTSPELLAPASSLQPPAFKKLTTTSLSLLELGAGPYLGMGENLEGQVPKTPKHITQITLYFFIVTKYYTLNQFNFSENLNKFCEIGLLLINFNEPLSSKIDWAIEVDRLGHENIFLFSCHIVDP